MTFLAFSTPLWPLAVLLISVAFVIVGISLLRLHAFMALILAGLLAGVLSGDRLLAPNATNDAEIALAKAALSLKDQDKGSLVRAVELTVEGFGKTAGTISIVIGMATIIGMCLMQSGAADKVVRRFLAFFGEKRAAMALLSATYVLSIPIFFDSMYMLMVPIAMAMALRTGKDFTLYTMAICAGGVITHSLTVPHPGPLFMVDLLKIDAGLSIWIGILVGIFPAIVAYHAIKWLNQRTPIPLRETPNAPLESVRATMARPESELPSFLASIFPVILPILLISAASVFAVIQKNHGWTSENNPQFILLKQWVDFIGNKNIALIIGAALSLWLLKRQKGLRWREINEMAGAPLETGGVIILITAAGGAFGYMLTQSGVGGTVEALAKASGMNLLLAAYLVAMIIRIAQGSATVAMQTAAGMFAALAPSLSCHPIYLFLCIGFGAISCSWMNDSGFWVVSRLSGFTERETLRTWTVLLTIISVSGFLFSWLLSALLPFHS